MASSGNFAVLHEILTKIAQDSTAYDVAHVPASKPSFDGDHTSGSISGTGTSFDPDRTTSVIESRQSHTSSKTKTYSKQSKGNTLLDEDEFDPEEQFLRPQNSPREFF